jgi:hypothetical protein
VTDRCTCGALPPEDARFCHKCGRPLYEEPGIEATGAPEIVVVPPPLPVEKPKINFHNSVAVRVALLAGGLISLFVSFPVPVSLALVWQLVILLAGGFFSVFLYERRTGDSLSVGSGARMGWITGIFCFVIMLVVVAIGTLAASNEPGFADNLRKALDGAGASNAERITQILQEPGGVAIVVISMIVLTFFLLTAVTVAGGALGAKVLEKE